MKRALFLLLINHNLILPDDIAEVEDTPYTINLTINVSNNNDVQSAHTTKVNSRQNLTPDQKDNESQPLSIQDLKSFINGYKWHIVSALAIGSYGLLYYYIVKGNHYLKRMDLWSSWKKELSLDEILAIPHQKFAHELADEIQLRYHNDLATALILFMKDIDKEEKDIRWYQSLYAWVSYFHVQKLMPFDKALYENIAQRLQKLAYYRACIEYLK